MEKVLYQRRKLHNQLAASYGQEAKDVRGELQSLLADHIEKPYLTVSDLVEEFSTRSPREMAESMRKKYALDPATMDLVMEKVGELSEAERHQFDTQGGSASAHERLIGRQRRRQRQT